MKIRPVLEKWKMSVGNLGQQEYDHGDVVSIIKGQYVCKRILGKWCMGVGSGQLTKTKGWMYFMSILIILAAASMIAGFVTKNMCKHVR